MNSPRAPSLTLLRDRVERLVFAGSRLISMPAWLGFALANPDESYLSYQDLLTATHGRRTVNRPSWEARQRHQIKWARRVGRLAKHYESHDLLEVGCGSGYASSWLQAQRFHVVAIDIEDRLAPSVRSNGIEFAQGDVCSGLPFPSRRFDCVYSVNAFEHFRDPLATWHEMLRVTRPGGIIYLSFGPLYFSPWGLHASRRLPMPYPQLLYSEETIQRYVNEKQAELASTYDELSDSSRIGPFVNRWSSTK